MNPLQRDIYDALLSRPGRRARPAGDRTNAPTASRHPQDMVCRNLATADGPQHSGNRQPGVILARAEANPGRRGSRSCRMGCPVDQPAKGLSVVAGASRGRVDADAPISDAPALTHDRAARQRGQGLEVAPRRLGERRRSEGRAHAGTLGLRPTDHSASCPRSVRPTDLAQHPIGLLRRVPLACRHRHRAFLPTPWAGISRRAGAWRRANGPAARHSGGSGARSPCRSQQCCVASCAGLVRPGRRSG